MQKLAQGNAAVGTARHRALAGSMCVSGQRLARSHWLQQDRRQFRHGRQQPDQDEQPLGASSNSSPFHRSRSPSPRSNARRSVFKTARPRTASMALATTAPTPTSATNSRSSTSPVDCQIVGNQYQMKVGIEGRVLLGRWAHRRPTRPRCVSLSSAAPTRRRPSASSIACPPASRPARLKVPSRS